MSIARTLKETPYRLSVSNPGVRQGGIRGLGDPGCRAPRMGLEVSQEEP